MSSINDDIERLQPWFHNLHLPDGTQTAPEHPLGDFPLFKWRDISLHIPQNLAGWSVLDIGCNAGFYSFELAKRGANVTAIDIDKHYLSQAEWAVNIFNLNDQISFKEMQVYDLARCDFQFDIVWYMGVFYHLRYPFLTLDIISRITRKLLVFQTMTVPSNEEYQDVENIRLFDRTVMNQDGWPKMAFVEHYLEDDPTNWWVPNHACVASMLRTAGFRVVARPSHEVYLCVPDGMLIEKNDMREIEYRAATGI
jgi:tRNA (mo5U34)-methyltransferase